MRKNDYIRVAIIGAGRNTTSRHIPGLQAIEGVEIVGVCNRSQDSSRRVAEAFSIPKTYDNWQEAIDDIDVDAIVVGTWPYMHCRVTLAALEASKHVMTEARMAMNVEEAACMLEAAQANPQLVTQIVPSPMTLEVDNTIRRLLLEGYLGTLLAVELRACNGRFLDPEAPMTWRQNRDLSGCNTLTLGIWYEAIMRWIGEATRVTAMGKVFVPMRKDSQADALRAVHIPDHLDVVADMACGAQAHLQFSNAAGLASAERIYLIGSEGTLALEHGTLLGGRKGDETLDAIPIPEEEKGRWRVEEEFINAIRGIEPITHTTFEDGLKYMRFTEAVIRSMEEGRTMPV